MTAGSYFYTEEHLSGKAMKWAWTQQLPIIEKLVLMSLAYHADNDGLAWPKSASLRDKTGLSRSGLKLQVRKLEKAGLITRENRFTERGRQTSNMYQLSMGGDTIGDPSPGHACVTPPRSPVGDPLDDIQYDIQEGDTIGGEPQETTMKINDVLTQHLVMTREEIFQKALRKNNKLTPGACAYLWRNCRTFAAEDNGFQAELLIKEKKMLHNAYKRVGEDYNLAVWAVMADWIGFTKHAAEMSGAFNMPHRPTVQFFIKFIESALDFTKCNDNSQGSGFVQLTAKPHKDLTKPNGKTENTHNAITSDELAAISGEF